MLSVLENKICPVKMGRDNGAPKTMLRMGKVFGTQDVKIMYLFNTWDGSSNLLEQWLTWTFPAFCIFCSQVGKGGGEISHPVSSISRAVLMEDGVVLFSLLRAAPKPVVHAGPQDSAFPKSERTAGGSGAQWQLWSLHPQTAGSNPMIYFLYLLQNWGGHKTLTKHQYPPIPICWNHHVTVFFSCAGPYPSMAVFGMDEPYPAPEVAFFTMTPVLHTHNKLFPTFLGMCQEDFFLRNYNENKTGSVDASQCASKIVLITISLLTSLIALENVSYFLMSKFCVTSVV